MQFKALQGMQNVKKVVETRQILHLQNPDRIMHFCSFAGGGALRAARPNF